MDETAKDSLQFEKAEIVEPEVKEAPEAQCALCKTPLSSYFEVNRAVLCASCKDQILALRAKSHLPGLVRAAVLGLLAAVAGAALYFGIWALTGYQLGLIAIVVGLMVGFAVRKAAAGRGGWRYQALAMALTYVAICSTYAATAVKEIQVENVSIERLLAIAPFLPVMIGFKSPMVLIIIGIALYEAWKVNRAPGFSMSGPFAVRGGRDG